MPKSYVFILLATALAIASTIVIWAICSPATLHAWQTLVGSAIAAITALIAAAIAWLSIQFQMRETRDQHEQNLRLLALQAAVQAATHIDEQINHLIDVIQKLDRAFKPLTSQNSRIPAHDKIKAAGDTVLSLSREYAVTSSHRDILRRLLVDLKAYRQNISEAVLSERHADLKSSFGATRKYFVDEQTTLVERLAKIDHQVSIKVDELAP